LNIKFKNLPLKYHEVYQFQDAYKVLQQPESVDYTHLFYFQKQNHLGFDAMILLTSEDNKYYTLNLEMKFQSSSLSDSTIEHKITGWKSQYEDLYQNINSSTIIKHSFFPESIDQAMLLFILKVPIFNFHGKATDPQKKLDLPKLQSTNNVMSVCIKDLYSPSFQKRPQFLYDLL